MTSFLIYGKGWISGFFTAELEKRNIKYIVGNARVDDDEALEKEICDLEPTNIVSCIGRTHGPSIPNIDYLEGNTHVNLKDNLYAPLNLAFICQKKGIHLTYIGTGCIFEYDDLHLEPGDGKKCVGFSEKDNANFFGSSYSIVKGFTDRIFKKFENDALNVRIRMPISKYDHPRNFITKILGYKKLINVQNSMTVLDDWVPALIDLAIDKVTGTINATNPQTISHNEIMEYYKKYVDPNHKWENFNIEEQDKILAARRSNNFLETAKIESLAQTKDIPNINESIEKTLKNWIKQ